MKCGAPDLSFGLTILWYLKQLGAALVIALAIVVAFGLIVWILDFKKVPTR